MNVVEALERLRRGSKIRRQGWPQSVYLLIDGSDPLLIGVYSSKFPKAHAIWNPSRANYEDLKSNDWEVV